MLCWRPLPYDPGKFFVKGTELAQALCGRNSRFAIVEVRTLERDGFSGVRYAVRDAAQVSDDDLRAGKRPPIVFRADSVDECLDWVQKQ